MDMWVPRIEAYPDRKTEIEKAGWKRVLSGFAEDYIVENGFELTVDKMLEFGDVCPELLLF